MCTASFLEKVLEFSDLKLNGPSEKEMPMKIRHFYNKIWRWWEEILSSNQMVPFKKWKNYNTPMGCSKTTAIKLLSDLNRNIILILNSVLKNGQRGLMFTVSRWAKRLCPVPKIKRKIRVIFFFEKGQIPILIFTFDFNLLKRIKQTNLRFSYQLATLLVLHWRKFTHISNYLLVDFFFCLGIQQVKSSIVFVLTSQHYFRDRKKVTILFAFLPHLPRPFAFFLSNSLSLCVSADHQWKVLDQSSNLKGKFFLGFLTKIEKIK